MEKDKEKIKHFLANILTVFGYELKGEKNAKILRNAGIALMYEDLLMGKDLDVFKEVFDLRETLEMISGMFENLSLEGESFKINCDKNHLSNAFKYLFAGLDGKVKVLLSANGIARVEAEGIEEVFNLDKPIDYLNSHELENSKLPLSLAVEIIKGLGAKVKLKDGAMEIICVPR